MITALLLIKRHVLIPHTRALSGNLVHVCNSGSHLLLVLVHDVVLPLIQLVQLLPQPAAALLDVLRCKAAPTDGNPQNTNSARPRSETSLVTSKSNVEKTPGQAGRVQRNRRESSASETAKQLNGKTAKCLEEKNNLNRKSW